MVMVLDGSFPEYPPPRQATRNYRCTHLLLFSTQSWVLELWEASMRTSHLILLRSMDLFFSSLEARLTGQIYLKAEAVLGKG